MSGVAANIGYLGRVRSIDSPTSVLRKEARRIADGRVKFSLPEALDFVRFGVSRCHSWKYATVVPAQRVTSVSGDSKSTNVLNSIPYMSWTYDADGALDYVNKAWTLQTGRSVEDGLTRDTMWEDLLATNESESFVGSLASAITNNLAFRHEVRFKKGHAATKYHWHMVNVEPALGPDGKAASWTGIAVDIDDLKRADDALLERERQYQQELARSTLFQLV